jgi:hypothetical protein
VLSVGVIGHRPDRLPEGMQPRIAREIAETLAAIRAEALSAYGRYTDCFAESAPRLALVTALAEGTDRMAAKSAIVLGFDLETPLPFVAEEYEKDFESHDSKASFRGLLSRACTVLELGGNRAHEGRSYEAAGLVVLDMADILVAAWDGGAARGRGGTVELVAEAGRRGMPVVRVDVSGSAPPRLHWRGLGDRHTAPLRIEDHPAATLESALAAAIEAQIRPPQNPVERDGLDRYLAERRRWVTASVEYPLLMLLLGVRWPRLGDILSPQPEKLANALSEFGSAQSAIGAAFGWADSVAARFAQVFRSAMITNFLVSAVAVLVGVMSLAYPLSAIELVLVFFLVLNAFIGHSRRWHHRWIESREVAERLRAAAPMHTLATRAPGPFGAATTWPAWYVRAVSREAGLRGGRLDDEALASALAALRKLVSGQAAYHETTARRFQRLHDRLAMAGQILFVAALILAAGTFAGKAFHLFTATAEMSRWIILASASFPALASASYGIRLIGDFEGAAKRSGRMRGQLSALASALQKGSSDFESLRDRAHEASDVMLGDVATWRLAAESRELAMPG